jgi:hypothetical protein
VQLPSFSSSTASPEDESANVTQDVSGREISRRRTLWLALQLSWHKQKGHLFTSWVHVPLGIGFLLTICWGFRLAINEAPFRFPAPVITMVLVLCLLLLLDWMSSLFPGEGDRHDVEKKAVEASSSPRKRFVDPIMVLLAPPCEFCLRNM